MLRDENQEGERLTEKERGGRDGLGAEHQKCCLDLLLEMLLTYFICDFVIHLFT